MGRMRVLRLVAVLFMAGIASCVAERASAPALFALDDAGTGQWITVSSGAEHSCGLDVQGRAWCWGSNSRLQLGSEQTASTCGVAESGCSLVPIAVETGRAFVSISAGRSHTCAISTDSVPYCWGSNSEGQLGVAGPGSAVARIPVPIQMVAISAGSAHSCGIRVDGLLMCWGSNELGAVGVGAGPGVAPTIVGGNQRYAGVEASDDRTCARTLAGRIICWGATWTRSSGDTNFVAIRSSPTLIAEMGLMRNMDVGPNSTCSLDPSGFVWCWETNVHGESGTGPGDGTRKPRRVSSDDEFMSISLGASHACAIRSDGLAFCWGDNRSGQLGAVATDLCGPTRSTCSYRPAMVGGRQKFVALSAGLGNHVCGVSDQQNLYCWGSGSMGQRGDGTRTAASRIPRLAVRVHAQ